MATTLAVATPSTANTTSYASGSFTPTAGILLVVCAVFTGSTDTVPTCVSSLSDQSFYRAIRSAKNNGDTMAIWVAENPARATSQTVTVGCASSATGCDIVVTQTPGMNRWGSNAVRQTGSGNGAIAVTPNFVMGAAALTTNVVIGQLGNQTNPATATPPTSFTELADQGHATTTNGQEVAIRDSGHNSTTVTWGAASATAWGVNGVELDTSYPVTHFSVNPMPPLIAQ